MRWATGARPAKISGGDRGGRPVKRPWSFDNKRGKNATPRTVFGNAF
jgi:hypothetical protein